MSNRNAYMTDELEAIYRLTVDFVAREVQPEGLAWEEQGKVLGITHIEFGNFVTRTSALTF